MTTEQVVRSRAIRRRQAARDSLLDPAANALLQSVRDIVCEPTRTQIVRVLSAGPLPVTDLATTLDRSKSATSQHLRVLRDAGIVTPRRKGRTVTYALTAAPMVDAAVEMIDRAATLAAA